MKNVTKRKNQYIHVFGWEMPQKLPVDGFEWNKNNSKFN